MSWNNTWICPRQTCFLLSIVLQVICLRTVGAIDVPDAAFQQVPVSGLRAKPALRQADQGVKSNSEKNPRRRTWVITYEDLYGHPAPTAEPTLSNVPQTPAQSPTPVPVMPTHAPAFMPVPAPHVTLLDIVSSDPTLSTLLTAASTAGLGGALGQSAGPLTLFAPNNNAFNAVGMTYVAKLLTPGFYLQLTDLLLSHLAAEELLAANLTNGFSFTTVNNQIISVTVNGGQQIELVPPSVAKGLAPPIPFVKVDELAVNGVLHIIAGVILPTWVFTNPVTAISSLPQFSTVTSLISAAGLTDAVMGLMNQTLVLPNNDAIAALPNATVAYLTNPANVNTLQKVLEYHILGEMLPYTKLPVGSASVTTLEGESVVVNVSMGSNGGKTIAFNQIPVVGSGVVLTKDNLIYELGGVLIPPSLVSSLP